MLPGLIDLEGAGNRAFRCSSRQNIDRKCKFACGGELIGLVLPFEGEVGQAAETDEARLKWPLGALLPPRYRTTVDSVSDITGISQASLHTPSPLLPGSKKKKT